MSNRFRDVDALLNGLFPSNHQTLQEIFDKRVYELELSPTSVYKMLGIQYRTIKGILTGTQKLIDITNLAKISDFLQIPKKEVVTLYLEAVERNFPPDSIPLEKIDFIKANFNLAVLRKSGLISSITDFVHIDRRLTERLGLKSIFEYRHPSNDIAFSSGVFRPENSLVRANWIKFTTALFEEIDNPYPYRREELMRIFTNLRRHSMDVKRGLAEVIKMLYKVGITVLVLSPLQTLQLRGATFSVNNKPCIALTNYRGFYATLWFGLIHELYHTLFDWEDIRTNRYHLTDDSNEELSVRERELEADNFAREYLLPYDKIKLIRPYINDNAYVQEFAISNQVHPSIAYVFNAFEAKGTDSKAWARAKAHSPDVEDAIKDIGISWGDERPLEEIIKPLKATLYN